MFTLWLSGVAVGIGIGHVLTRWWPTLTGVAALQRKIQALRREKQG